MIEHAYNSKCPICGGVKRSVLAPIIWNSAEQSELDKEASRIAKLLYDGKFEGVIDPAMTELVANKLMNAVYEGFGKNFDNIDYASKDLEMLASLERNV